MDTSTTYNDSAPEVLTLVAKQGTSLNNTRNQSAICFAICPLFLSGGGGCPEEKSTRIEGSKVQKKVFIAQAMEKSTKFQSQ